MWLLGRGLVGRGLGMTVMRRWKGATARLVRDGVSLTVVAARTDGAADLPPEERTKGGGGGDEGQEGSGLADNVIVRDGHARIGDVAEQPGVVHLETCEHVLLPDVVCKPGGFIGPMEDRSPGAPA